jgi:phosphonoacetate hydrolase
METVARPERPGGQGLDENQYESGERAIHLLLTDPVVGTQTDFVSTYRDGAYEVWAKRGMVRFQRLYAPDGGYEYRIVEQIGENPIEQQGTDVLRTLADELAAAERSGFSETDPARAFVGPEHLTYPFAYERISQLFDGPNAPDLIVNPKSYAFGRQPGQHGSLDVIQSRALLFWHGPGVRAGVIDAACRQVDIAPTIARLMGFPLIDGKDVTGRTSSERGRPPDVYLRRQDGRVLDEILDLDDGGELRARPERAYLIDLDGLSSTELRRLLEQHPEGFPNLRRLLDGAASFRDGCIVTYPSITWPSHDSIGTGAWCGHHDLVNPTYYIRERREVVTPQGNQFDTEGFLSPDVETLFEAFHRVYGPWQGDSGAFTASIIDPCGRGADHAVLERRLVGDLARLDALTTECKVDMNPRWEADGFEDVYSMAMVDNRGLAQVLVLFTDDTHPPPMFVYHALYLTDASGHDYGPHHEAVAEALAETDLRLGRILGVLEERGLLDGTLLVITADHGMATVDVSLKANQVGLLPRQGMKVHVSDGLVYLLDMAVDVAPSADGRTATITVLENDADESGERPPIEGAEVVVSGPGGTVLARARTDRYGVAGVPLPPDLAPEEVVVAVRHDDFNPRHLRLDGTSVLPDLRELLYG